MEWVYKEKVVAAFHLLKGTVKTESVYRPSQRTPYIIIIIIIIIIILVVVVAAVWAR